VQRSRIDFPVGVDPTTTISQGEFHLAGMPDTVFVNSNGTVANVVIGAVTNAELSADISAMS
jgi:thiol:disulfide interchange protein